MYIYIYLYLFTIIYIYTYIVHPHPSIRKHDEVDVGRMEKGESIEIITCGEAVSQDQREILQERQLINNPVTQKKNIPLGGSGHQGFTKLLWLLLWFCMILYGVSGVYYGFHYGFTVV